LVFGFSFMLVAGWSAFQMGGVAHLGPSSLSSSLLVSSSSSAIAGGGLQFGHLAVAFMPTSLERGGARWGRVALADLGDVAVGSA